MFFSRVWIDASRRGARRLLASPQRVHAVVAGATEDGSRTTRPLWRLDAGQAGLQLLVVSAAEPDFTSLLEQCDIPAEDGWQTTSYEPFLSTLEAGQTWQFRLAANPVKNVRQVTDPAALPRGKRVPVVGIEGVNAWLLSRSERMGVILDPNGFVVAEKRPETFHKRKNTRKDDTGTTLRVSISRVVYDGILQVKDPEALRNTLTTGAGSAKAYGCGLLTLAPN